MFDEDLRDVVVVFVHLPSISDAFRHEAVFRGLWDDVVEVVPLVLALVMSVVADNLDDELDFGAGGFGFFVLVHGHKTGCHCWTRLV